MSSTLPLPAAAGTPAARPSLRRVHRQESRTAWLMSAPALAALLLFVVLPFVLAIVFSFTNQRLLSPNPTEFVGLRNYDRLLSVTVVPIQAEKTEAGQPVLDAQGQPQYPRLRSVVRGNPAYVGYEDYREVSALNVDGTRYTLVAKDPLFWRGLFNIAFFVLLVVPLQCGAALGCALLINQKLPGMTLYRTIFFSPVVISMVVISIVWTFLYDRQYGLVNQLLGNLSFGLIQPIDWLGDPAVAMVAIVIMSAWQAMGFQMVIFLAGLQSISPDLYEAASLDGAKVWNKFRHITLPGLRNTTVFILTATTMQAFALFTQIDVMTQGGPEDSTVTVMYSVVRTGFREQDIAYGSTITVVFFVIILLIAFLQRRLITGSDK